MRSSTVLSFDARIREWSARYSPVILRITLGVVFVWFGGLKIFGVSPVEDLVIKTVPWMEPGILVAALGFWEVVIGIGLITGIAFRIVLLMFMLQMIGTFFSAVMQPQLMIKGSNPLALTLEGEFLLKNLVLLAAGAATAAGVPPPSRRSLLQMLFSRAKTRADTQLG